MRFAYFFDNLYGRKAICYRVTRVATEMSEFINRYDDTRDCTWSVVVDRRIGDAEDYLFWP